jgi:hypothetical protein
VLHVRTRATTTAEAALLLTLRRTLPTWILPILSLETLPMFRGRNRCWRSSALAP